MEYKSAATIMILLAILVIIAIAGRVFEAHYFRTRSIFATILFTALVSGLVSSIIVEKIDAKILA